MSHAVPTLRAPLPGQRQNSSAKMPKLGLAIPPPVSPRSAASIVPQLPDVGPPARPAPPALRLNPSLGGAGRFGRPQLTLAPLALGSSTSVSSNINNSTSSQTLDSSRTPADGGCMSSSTASSVSGFAMSGESLSAVGSAASTGGASPGLDIHLDMRDLEKHLDAIRFSLGGKEPDVVDLDDEGWQAVSKAGRILELGSLGEGAGGAVTRCVLKGGTTVFALKVITTNPDPDFKRQIVRELNFNKSCESDYVCRYYGAFDVDSTISIAMEFCEGGSLDSIYKECRRLQARAGEKVIGKVADGVLRGLTYLFEKRIIHRDIKPSNILLCKNGQVKLCDFGVSGEFGTKGDANTFIGTSYYMAPERITGQKYNINSDVWSLGVTLLEVAQHRFPFGGDGSESHPRAGLIDLLTYIVGQPLPKLQDEPDQNIKWSDKMKDFIDCCLVKDPRRRKFPWDLLEHSWLLEIRTKKVNIQQFLKQPISGSPWSAAYQLHLHTIKLHPTLLCTDERYHACPFHLDFTSCLEHCGRFEHQLFSDKTQFLVRAKEVHQESSDMLIQATSRNVVHNLL